MAAALGIGEDLNCEAPDEFGEVYRRYAGPIYRYCLFRTNSRQEAEDVTAEAFARFLEKGAGRDKLTPSWLFKVAANLCVDYHRKAARIKSLGDDMSALPAFPTEAPSPWRDADIWRALSKLREIERQVIYLKAIEDMSFREVAAFLRKRENSVKALFYRGIDKLRKALEEVDSDVRELRAPESTGA